MYLGWIHLASKWGLCAFYPDGTQKWFYEIQPSGGGTPLLNPPALLESAKTVYTYSSGAGVFAINIDNGSLKWNKSYYSYTNLVIGDDGILYFIALSYSPNESYWYLIGLDESGKEVLSYKIGAPVGSDAVSSPTIDKEGTVYFGYNDTLFALSPNGTKKWQITFVGGYNYRPPTTPQVTTPTIADDGTIYVVVKKEGDYGGPDPGYHNHLHAIDPENPKEGKWNRSLRSNSPQNPVICFDGNVYVTNNRYVWGNSGGQSTLIVFTSEGDVKICEDFEGYGFPSLLLIDAENAVYVLRKSVHGSATLHVFDTDGNQTLISLPFQEGHRNSALSLGSDGTLYVGGHKNLYAVSPSISSNNPPNPPTILAQLKSDCATVIPVGDTTDERTVIFKGDVSDPDGDKVRLQVELRNLNEYGGQFDETKEGLFESDLVENGSKAAVSRGQLIDADYHWRARAVDEHGEPSNWADFGNNDILEADFTVAGITYTYDPQAAVNYAETWWNSRNSTDPDACDPYKDYGDYDCANFVSQCLIAGGLDLSGHPDADPCKCIPRCTKLHDYLVNYLGVTWDTRLKDEEEPEWFNLGDPAIFGYTDDTGAIHPYAHAVIAVTRDGIVRCDAHSVNRHNITIQDFYNISALFDDNPFDRCTFYHIPSPAKPILTSPLEITPEKDTYYVGDTLSAEFTIKNIGDVPITLDQLLVGGRFNDGKLPDGEFPDFAFQSVTLQPNVPHQYTGTLELDITSFIGYNISFLC